MKLNHQEVREAPIPAASVILLREAAGGHEVFMLRRSAASAVLGGAYVFPGGKVDPGDAAAECLDALEVAAPELHAMIGDPTLDQVAAAAFFAAACRETQEEADVRLSVAALRPWSRWITPRVPMLHNRRFDTLFFVALLPKHQIARHDDHEAIEGEWIRPAVALDRYWAGGIVLAAPQIMTLVHLSRHASAAEAIAGAHSRRPPLIQPEPFEIDGSRAVAYPGDERHPVAERAIPGPLRLVYRGGRLEPIGGFDEFFA